MTREYRLIHRICVLAALTLLCLPLVACGKSSREFEEQAIATADQPAVTDNTVVSPAAAEAKQLFGSLCATCHGPHGRGDGPAAASLSPKPRDYSDKAWQAATTDDQLRTVILKGGAAVGKSPTMPPAPQLEAKPEVVTELVTLIRTYGE